MQPRPKKRFGQNFLRDQSVVAKILAAARLEAEDRVLEIGPGLGALTDRLLAAAGEVTVMEVDRDLIAGLQARQESRLRIVEGDCLNLDWPALLDRPPYKLVANLPYNISSQVLFRILDHRELFSRLVLMFQKEVGDRLCAAPGTSAYGILSVFCQLVFDIRRVTVVAPGAFFPPPRSTLWSWNSFPWRSRGWPWSIPNSSAGWSRGPSASAARPCATPCSVPGLWHPASTPPWARAPLTRSAAAKP